MASDDVNKHADDNFSLNITNEVATKRKKEVKPSQNKRKRLDDSSVSRGTFLKQNKRNNLDKNSEFASGLDDEPGSSVSHSLSRNKDSDQFQKDSGARTFEKQNKGHNEKKMHISSLFNSNPEVPHIPVSKEKVFKPKLFTKKSFDVLDLHPHLVSCLKSRFKIEKMTEVQEKSLPVLLNGKDALIKSCTGSGKTLVYAIPIIQQLQALRPKIQRLDGVYALVVLPTRELVLQSYRCFSELTKAFTWIVPGYLIGGEKKKSEKARIRKGINILITTPGRLLDHLDHTENLNLHKIKWLIIDEADRLLEQGFEKSVLRITSRCTSTAEQVDRQTALLSATLTNGVEKLAGLTMKQPEYINISTARGREELVVPSQLQQHVVVTPTKLRLVALSSFVADKCARSDTKVIIFFCSQRSVDFHFALFNGVLKERLKHGNHRAKFFKLHGDMKQEERTDIFYKFREAESGFLLTTDVASRGLDLPSVDWIVQYSVPSSPEIYVHRVGRTARIGRKGDALLFLIPSEIKFIDLLHKHKLQLSELNMNDMLASLLLLDDPESRQPHRPKSAENCATSLQLKYEDTVYAETELHDIARDAFLTYIQAYTTYPRQMKPIIPFKMLHLGHVAKSFCLREAPSELGCRYANSVKKERMLLKGKGLPYNRRGNETGTPKRSHGNISEFGSGLDEWTGDLSALVKRKKKNKM